VCLVAVLSYFGPRLQWSLMLHPQTVWPFWPSCALLVAVLVLVPRRIWPILIPVSFACIFLFDMQKGVPISSIVWFLVADTIEVLIAALCLSHFFDGAPRLNSVKAVARFLLFAVILAPSAAAFFAAPGIGGGYWFGWRVSFFSEVLALLTLPPAVFSWVSGGRAWLRKSLAYHMEAAALFATLVVFAWVAFASASHSYSTALLYSLVPCLLWSALRFGTIGISTSTIAVMFLSIWGAVHGRGPFIEPGPFDQVLSLQLFLFFTATPFMVLAALVEERKLADAELAETQRLAKLASWRWDVATDKVTWSEELYRISGRDPNLPAPSYREHPKFYTAESWNRLRRAVEEALNSGAPYELDLEMVRTDGTKRWLFARGETQRDTQGRIVQLHGTVQDITERKAAEEMVRDMSGRLITAHEEERSRIARELHDDLSQRMALLQISVQQFEQDETELASIARQKLNNIAEIASEISSDIHDLSHRLHPAKLDIVGLVPSLTSFCSEFSKGHQLRVQFSHDHIPNQIPKEVTLCLFRIVQEALQNVVKHSGAPEVNVELSGRHDRIELSVSDSGVGFDPASEKGKEGLGLLSMSERLRLIGGDLTVESEPSHGARIRVRIPLPATGAQITNKSEA
jgi:signal transduction histidine kinase